MRPTKRDQYKAFQQQLMRIREPERLADVRRAGRGWVAGQCFCPAHTRHQLYYTLIGSATLLPRCGDCPPLAYPEFTIVDRKDPITKILNLVTGYWLFHSKKDGEKRIFALPSRVEDFSTLQYVFCNVYHRTFELAFYPRDSEGGRLMRTMSVGGELISGLQ